MWQLVDESVLEDIGNEGNNPYEGRQVGVTKKVQEREANKWWKRAICPSCKQGFNSKSVQNKCKSCDKYTHSKRTCMSTEDDNTIVCKMCKPAEQLESSQDKTHKADGNARNANANANANARNAHSSQLLSTI